MTREQIKIILVLVPDEVGPMMTLVHNWEEAKASNCISSLFLSLHLMAMRIDGEEQLTANSFVT